MWDSERYCFWFNATICARDCEVFELKGHRQVKISGAFLASEPLRSGHSNLSNVVAGNKKYQVPKIT